MTCFFSDHLLWRAHWIYGNTNDILFVPVTQADLCLPIGSLSIPIILVAKYPFTPLAMQYTVATQVAWMEDRWWWSQKGCPPLDHPTSDCTVVLTTHLLEPSSLPPRGCISTKLESGARAGAGTQVLWSGMQAFWPLLDGNGNSTGWGWALWSELL